ncbi:hypothetical protein BDN72DRAFT_856888 [Pluteus cervinus]|uniref:Uncharacterized protein n=1 Tax=Pluteus cervinus TaxID=181527 RepID=A0ACD3AYT4_9AGAR|nr:hypothetical protein BDN72DRAFT_856888 [Pluteus cervinus]
MQPFELEPTSPSDNSKSNPNPDADLPLTTTTTDSDSSICSNCHSRFVMVQNPWPHSEPNMLESFSRTMRSYIPNIPIPIPTTAAPSPPLVSRPVSFGSFMTSTGGVAVQQQHIQDVQQLHLHQQHQHQLQQLQLSQQQYQHVLQHDGQREHVMVEDLQAYQPQYYQPQFGGIPPPPGSASPAWGASHARSSVSSTTTGPVVASPTSPTFAATQPIIPGTGTTTTARHILPVGNVPDPILWSRWDTFTSATATRRLLIIGYLTGIQVWDCTELKSVREVLNLDFVGRGVRNAWGDERGERDAGGAGADGAIGADESGWDGVGRYPLYAAILPDPFEETGTKGRVQGKKGKAKDDGETEGDGEVGGRPYLGLIMYDEDHEHDRDSPRGHTTFVVYSLAMNRVVKFVASERFVVISTARPPMIHVLSATTLESLFIIPSAALIPFAHKLGSTSISSVTSTTASNANEHGNSGSSDKTNNNNNISRNHKNIVSVSLSQDLDATLHPYSSPIITATSTQQHLPPPSGSNRYPQYSQAYPGTINQLQPLPAGIVNQPQLSSHSEVYHYPTSHPLLLAQPYPEPIFAFSGRLLAFASVTPSSPLHHTQHIHPQQHQPPHQQHQGHSSSRVATPISPTSAVSSPRLVAHRGGPGSRPSSGMASGSPGVPGSYGSVAGVPGSYGSSYGYPTSLGSNSSAGGSYGSGVVAGMTSGSVGSSIGAGVGAGGGSGFVGGLTSFTTGLSGLTGISSFTNMGSTQQQVQAAGSELGSAALKVGGSMLSGVKTLGGFAYSVAKSKALGGSGGVSVERGRSREGARGGSGDGASFFSKSAPTGGGLAGVVSSGDDDEYDESGRKERRFSSISATGGAGASASGGGVWDRLGLGGGGESASPTGNGSGDGKGEGYYVTVLDLGRRATSAIGHAASSNGSAPASSSPAARNTPLTTLNAVHPTVVHEFRAVKRQPVAQISFSDDGNSLVVAPKDGQNMLVFGLKPSSSAAGRERWSGGIVGDADRVEGGSKVAAAGPSSRPEVVSPQSTSATTTTSPMGTALPSHVYDLKRGRTSGVVEGVGWAKDGRWVAIGTRNRTVHVFSVNPYGGPPDVASHVEGRVRNVEAPQLLSTEVSPLVRLRPVKSPTNDQLRVPLSFVFVNPTDAQLPPSLLPPSSPTSSHGLGDGPTSSTSAHPNARSTRNGRSANYQDVLLFDPADGSLSLRRFTLEVHSTKEGRSALTSTVGASMSTIASALPGRLNSSPSTTRGRGRSPVGVGMGLSSSSSPRGSESPARGGGGAAGMGTSAAASYSGLTRMMDAQAVQLVARDSVAATWNLQRRRDWKIVLWAVGDTNVTGKVGVDKKVVDRAGSGHGRGHSRAQSHHALHDWLAQAELSTCSRSPHMLPRTIYLIHRFMFRTLGEDYHALIRRYQFDLAGPKINVRKEIEISAHGTGTTEAFIEGFSSSPNDRHTRRHSSAFDEPLATALAGALEYTPSPAVLPMLPNGAPGKTFIPSVPMPIRSVAGIDVNGVGESLGRIRRGVMHKVRSPPLLPRPDSANRDPYPISLEFDEEDEDFLYRDEENSKSLGVPTGGGRRKDVSVSPATSRSTGGTAVSGSVSTTATSAHLLDIEGDHSISVIGAGAQGTEDDADWHGWDTEDKFVVEEVERFDNISAVGFLDEEQERVKAAAAAGSSTTKQRRNLKKQR